MFELALAVGGDKWVWVSLKSQGCALKSEGQRPPRKAQRTHCLRQARLVMQKVRLQETLESQSDAANGLVGQFFGRWALQRHPPLLGLASLGRRAAMALGQLGGVVAGEASRASGTELVIRSANVKA